MPQSSHKAKKKIVVKKRRATLGSTVRSNFKPPATYRLLLLICTQLLFCRICVWEKEGKKNIWCSPFFGGGRKGRRRLTYRRAGRKSFNDRNFFLATFFLRGGAGGVPAQK